MRWAIDKGIVPQCGGRLEVLQSNSLPTLCPSTHLKVNRFPESCALELELIHFLHSY